MSSARISANIVGRDRELLALLGLVDGLPARGGAVALCGPAGTGKSLLLDRAVQYAGTVGTRTLPAAGVASERDIEFAGLHQVLSPLLLGAAQLPALHRAALESAFGMGTPDTPPDRFHVALAALELLSVAATTRPLLLAFDAVDEVDRSTLDVLSFVSRRVAHLPVGIVLAGRERGRPGWEELELGPLSPDEAVRLLDAHAGRLRAAARERILVAAAGNPLALIELPAAMEATPTSPWLPLPLTERLAAALARPVDDPASLAAAVADETGAAELRRAASYHAATPEQRRAAHEALAGRSALHRASAAKRPDEAVAQALDAFAERALERGAVELALGALEHAVALSVDPGRRGGRVLRTGELAAELGDGVLLARMVAEAERMRLAPFERFRLALLRELTTPDEPLDAAALGAAVDAAHGQDAALVGDMLLRIAMRCFTLPTEARGDLPDHLVRAVEPRGEDARTLLVEALVAPVRRGARVSAALARIEPPDGRTGWMLGLAGTLVWEAETALGFLNPAVRDLRGRELPIARMQARLTRGWARFYLGYFAQARHDGEETARAAEAAGLVYWAAGAHGLLAVLAAVCGDHEATHRHAHAAERFAVATGAAQTLAYVCLARGHEALGAGRQDEAFEHLMAMWDTAAEVSAPAIAELVDAAVHCGRVDEVRPVIARVEALCTAMPAPDLAVAVGLARALMAAPDEAEAAFAVALAVDLTRRPFSRARLQLAWGSWLRRRRRLVEARAPLATARVAFTAVGAIPWAEKARNELRSAGVTSGAHKARASAHGLTPQELEIARLAASGLSNREIGLQLYLSHRTVGAHLYRIFPKLAVTSRAQLRDALVED